MSNSKFSQAIIDTQMKMVRKYDASFLATIDDEVVGQASNLASGVMPLNGLRHPKTATTSGWYLWAGTELSQEADFFSPSHARHLFDLCPQVIPFLGLGPGWRFLLAEGVEDVWFDATLLNVED
jgi:hypothetical protein